MARGGAYAASARVWALKYSMAALLELDPESYDNCRARMNKTTYASYRQVGGGTRIQPHSSGIRAAFNALGVGEPAGDYEILAAWLASQVCI